MLLQNYAPGDLHACVNRETRSLEVEKFRQSMWQCSRSLELGVRLWDSPRADERISFGR